MTKLRESLCEILRTRLKTTEKSTKLNSRRTTLQVNKTFYFPLSLLWTSALRKHRYVTCHCCNSAYRCILSCIYEQRHFPSLFSTTGTSPGSDTEHATIIKYVSTSAARREGTQPPGRLPKCQPVRLPFLVHTRGKHRAQGFTCPRTLHLNASTVPTNPSLHV
jgi:hypothetical protein